MNEMSFFGKLFQIVFSDQQIYPASQHFFLQIENNLDSATQAAIHCVVDIRKEYILKKVMPAVPG
jgi:hypothetical protein